MIEIKVGDKFYAEESKSTYTVINVDGDKIQWDCIGRKHWMKNVRSASIEEWINDNRLIKLPD